MICDNCGLEIFRTGMEVGDGFLFKDNIQEKPYCPEGTIVHAPDEVSRKMIMVNHDDNDVRLLVAGNLVTLLSELLDFAMMEANAAKFAAKSYKSWTGLSAAEVNHISFCKECEATRAKITHACPVLFESVCS